MQFRGIVVPLQRNFITPRNSAAPQQFERAPLRSACTSFALEKKTAKIMKKVLIAYYSRRGENYVNGSIKNLKLGNTEVVAQKIKALLPDADVFQIDTTYEYSKSYMTCIEEAKQELHDNARPEVKNPLESIDQYDTIILGYPNWWGTMPMVVYTFLESYDFTGKTIIPFCTNEGSGMGSSVRFIKKLCPGANVEDGTPIHGAEAANANNEAREIANMAK